MSLKMRFVIKELLYAQIKRICSAVLRCPILLVLVSITANSQTHDSDLPDVSFANEHEAITTAYHVIASQNSPKETIAKLKQISTYSQNNNWQNGHLFAATKMLETFVLTDNVTPVFNEYDSLKALSISLNNSKIALQLDVLKLKALVVLGHKEQAEPIIQQLLRKAESLNNNKSEPKTVAFIYKSVGESQFTLGDFTHAIKWLTQAYNFYKQVTAPESSEILMSLGALYVQTNEIDLGISYLQERLEIARQNDNLYAQAITLHSMGKAFIKKGELDTARDTMDAVLTIATQLNDDVGIAYAKQAIGNILVKKNMCIEALPNLEFAEQIFHEINNFRPEIQTVLRQVDCLVEANQTEAATEKMKRALELSKTINTPRDLIDMYQTKAMLDYAKADYQNAYDTIVKNFPLQNLIEKEARDEALLRTQVKFDSELKEKKNQILQQQNELQLLKIEQQAKKQTAYIVFTILTSSLLIVVVVLLCLQTVNRNKFKQLAMRDYLTDSPNRRAVIAFAEQMHQHAVVSGINFAVAMVDLDYFKSLNDTYGHNIGDQVLVQFAHACKASIRNQDAFGRYGGEEWMLVMPDIKPEAIKNVFERIGKSLNSHSIESLDQDTSITFSMGVSWYEPSVDKSLNSLIKRADDRLYLAKERGRNRLVTTS